jgi:hypothetical protein
MATGMGGPARAADGRGPVVTPLAIGFDEVSHDGRYLWDGDASQVVDRLTGARSAPACGSNSCSAGFVRDNPVLVLTFEYGPRPFEGEEYEDDHWNRGPLTGVYLTNTATGARQRIDTDSTGAALVPAWQNQQTCGNKWCDNFYDFPDIFVGPGSVSRDGRTVAFCSNYAQPKVPVLHIKNLATGRLTRTGLQCPTLDAMGGESTATASPTISADGRVVHLNGNVSGDGVPVFKWGADTLYFTRTATVRSVKGWGSMTRDGGTIFMRLGVPRSSVPRSSITVGAYNVKSRKVTRLPGRDQILGTPMQWFSAVVQASYRGRFVVGLTPTYTHGTYGEVTDVRVTAVDRRSGATTDIVALLREGGYEPDKTDRPPVISGDGKVIFAATATGPVAITGWEPTAHVTVGTNASLSKLVVNVDPDKGSGFWAFRVQVKRADGTRRTLKKVYRTQGPKETRTIDLPSGTYRVKVKTKYGYRGATSAEVRLAN